MRSEFSECRCYACNGLTLWHLDGNAVERALWPPAMMGPAPNPDMPPDVRAIYDEARSVASFSPRSAAALLRTGTEVLLRQITGDANSTLNDLIGGLVRQGRLDAQTQKAADLLRLSGNDAVHPSEIQMSGDEQSTGASLFVLINLLIERLMTFPRQLESMFDALPERKRDQIAKRNAGTATEPESAEVHSPEEPT